MSAPIRLLTADDHPILREGLSAILSVEPDFEVVGQAADGREALDSYARLRPDVVLMDLRMPKMDGVAATTAIRRDFPTARIIILTTFSGDVEAQRALKAGAMAYLLKSTLRKDLVTAIRAVHAGRRHVPPEIASAIAIHTSDASLSERETRILQRVASGGGNREVAAEFGLSEETVKAHLRNIFSKLGASDRTQAVTTALRRGIIAL